MIEKNLQSIDGVKIHYEVFEGKKSTKTLVFIHGFGGSLRAFDPIVENFKQDQYKIINIDLRAHGKSERPKKSYQYGLNYFINDLVLILHQEKATNVTLIGHCFGGILALGLAINYPYFSQSMVLINVSYKAPDLSRMIYRYFPMKGLIFFMLKFFPNLYLKNYPAYAKYENSGDFNPRRIGSDVLHTSPKSYLYITREIVNFNFSHKLSKINNNVLLVHGEKDRVFPLKNAFELAKKLPHSKLSIIKNGNHLTVLNKRTELIKIIKENLAQKFL